MTSKIPAASVHGRFQPFHLEHLDYICAAFQKAEFLHIGVTQFETSQLKGVVGAGQHREDQASNPLSYFERAEVISLAVRAAGYGAACFRISPFPIENAVQLVDFLPLSIPVFTTRVDDWNDRKIEMLSKLGYSVETLFERDPKGVAGSTIRALMVEDDDAWRSMVPEATIGYLESLSLGDRIRRLSV